MAKLPNLPTANNKKSNKQFKKSQPFWNEELEICWKNVCRAEKSYLSFKVQNNTQLQLKTSLRLDFKEARKSFEKKFRYLNRSHKKKDFDDLSNLSDSNPTEMWAKLQRLCDPPSSRAALEILRADGSVSSDIKEILERWHEDIPRLFSCLRENPEMAFNEEFYQEIKEKRKSLRTSLTASRQIGVQ